MARRFRLLVFDWDGTLMDSAQAIVESLKAACRDLEVIEPTDERAQHVIGLGWRDALGYAVPSLEPHRYEQLLERYRHHWRQLDLGTTLFAGVAEALADLRASGFLLAVATGKSRRGLARALDATGIGHLLHATRCADESSPKPDPQMLFDLMHTLDASAEETLMIGDTTHDLQMARNAGVAALAVAYGAHPRTPLLELTPLDCVDCFGDLKAWLDRHA